MKLEIADISTNEKKRLEGFKILGIFPFYVRYICTLTHIKLCKIREEIQKIQPEPQVSDFYDSKIQEKAIPLLNRFIRVALVNNRPFGWLFAFFLDRKLKTCSHYHLWNLYFTIHKLDEPAFFLSYWKLINQRDNTLLREVKQS